MSNKIVSIITPSFNRAYIVHETAESIFNQTYPHWQWVIVDDGSTDDSITVLQEYANKDSRVKVFRRDRDPKGACVCRNIAVENCIGDYVLFLDTDDLLAPHCLEQRVKAMEENPECDFVIFPMMLFRKQPDDLGLLWNIETGEDDLARIMKNDAICQGTGTLWKKSSFTKIGMWREDLKLWQDVELHVRSLLWPMKYTRRMDLQPDVYLRISDDSLSRVGYNALPKMQSRINVFTYTTNAIIEKGLFEKYREALRVMSNDIITSAIRSNHYNEAESIITFCGDAKLFSKAEIKTMYRYLSAVKFKLSRIKAIDTYYFNKIKQAVPLTKDNIGKHKFATVA